jgi:hypothetical protein
VREKTLLKIGQGQDIPLSPPRLALPFRKGNEK